MIISLFVLIRGNKGRPLWDLSVKSVLFISARLIMRLMEETFGHFVSFVVHFYDRSDTRSIDI